MTIDQDSDAERGETQPHWDVLAPEPSQSRARRARPRPTFAAAYTLLIGAFLWPMPARPTSTIYGYGGDNFGLIYDITIGRSRPQAYWRPTEIDHLSFPFGYVDSNWTRVVTFIPDAITWPLSGLVGAVATYNVLIVIGLLGTALAACWLVTYATDSRAIGLWGGLVFALFPFIQQAATAWPSFTHMYWLPLAVLASFHYRDRPSRNRLVILPAIALGASLTNPYVGLFTFVVLSACSIVWARPVAGQIRALSPVQRRRLALASVGVGALAVFTFVGFVVVLRGSVERPLSDLDAYGLRLRELLKPSYLHHFAMDWIGPLDPSDFHGSNASETAQFVGWSTIVLAIIGSASPRSGAREGRQRLLALVGIGLGLVIGASQLVYFGILPAPARLLHEFAPFFRVYSRLGVVVFLFLLLLAAHGVAVLVQGRARAAKISIVGGLGVLAFVELWAPLPGRYSSIEQQDFAAAVEGTAPVVAYYPLVRSDDGYFYQQLIWSLDLPDGARLVNGGPTAGEAEGFRDQVRSLNSEQTWNDLASSGVDYVIVDKSAYASRFGGPPSITRGAHMFDDGEFSVYRLSTRTAPVAWTSGEQFPAEVQPDGPSWRWIGQDVDLSVRSTVDACVLVSGIAAAPDGNVALTVASQAPSELTIRDDDDDPRFELPLPVLAGTTRFSFRPDRSTSELTETDSRRAAIMLSDLVADVVEDSRCE